MRKTWTSNYVLCSVLLESFSRFEVLWKSCGIDEAAGEVICTINNNATIGERKNKNLPGVKVDLPVLTEKDIGCDCVVNGIFKYDAPTPTALLYIHGTHCATATTTNYRL